MSIFTGIAMGQYLVAGIIIVMLLGGGVLERYAIRKASVAQEALAGAGRVTDHSGAAACLNDIAGLADPGKCYFLSRA